MSSDFERLLSAEISAARNYALALTRNAVKADDLLQDALLRAWDKQHLWEPGTNLGAWLRSIVHNEHVNYVRREMRRAHIQQAWSEGAEEVGTTRTEQEIFGRLQNRDLAKAMEALTKEQRTVVLLVADGMTYGEAAREIGVCENTVRSQLSRARQKLGVLMGGIPEKKPASPVVKRRKGGAPLSKEVQEAAIAMLKTDPSPERVAAKLKKQYGEGSISYVRRIAIAHDIKVNRGRSPGPLRRSMLQYLVSAQPR